MEGSTQEEIMFEICKIIYFFNGGFSYKELQNMPLPEVFDIIQNMKKIQNGIETELRKNNIR
jgi:hypothetical protein